MLIPIIRNASCYYERLEVFEPVRPEKLVRSQEEMCERFLPILAQQGTLVARTGQNYARHCKARAIEAPGKRNASYHSVVYNKHIVYKLYIHYILYYIFYIPYVIYYILCIIYYYITYTAYMLYNQAFGGEQRSKSI